MEWAVLNVSNRSVRRTFDPHCALSEYVRVEHGAANVSVAQQFLYCADVVPRHCSILS
jgi:hypothetical protein